MAGLERRECRLLTCIILICNDMVLSLLVLLVYLFLPSVRAFAPIVTSRTSCSNNYRLSLSTGSNDNEDSKFISTFFNTITQRYQLFQQSKSEGYDFKQSTTISIAGTYDANDVQSKINDHVASAPCVKSLVLFFRPSFKSPN